MNNEAKNLLRTMCGEFAECSKLPGKSARPDTQWQ